MSPQRSAVLAVLFGTLVLNGWVAAELAGLGSPGIENGGARIAVYTPRATAIAKDSADGVSAPDAGSIDAALPPVAVAERIDAALAGLRAVLPPARIASVSTPDPVQNDVAASAPSVEAAETVIIDAALPDPSDVLPPVRIASASTPDPVQNEVAASAAPVEVAETGSADAALPAPREVLPPVRIASAGTPDPVQDDVAASAPAVEAAETVIIDAALPDPREVLPPVRIASAGTPDPVQDDVAASAPAVEAAGTGIIDAALPDAREALPPVRIASASTPEPVQNVFEASAPRVEAAEMASVDSALPDPREMLPPATPPVRLVSLFRPAPVEENLKPAARPVETPNECLVAEICIDEYLWSFYERTPKVDTNKMIERIKATVRKKGKTRTITRTITRYVVGDFTWKDPIAAQKFGMSVKDYVIGGMDRSFKLKLYHALRAMEDAGLMPGITSAFRDDYRQSIAVGNKAASDSSFHGGSRRGGYGYGLAADLVSVKGETRLERFASSRELWKWIDAREKELGIGRPYLDRDPPHVAPIDGKEYGAKRGGAKARLAASIMNRRQPVAFGGHPSVKKPATKAGLVRVGSL